MAEMQKEEFHVLEVKKGERDEKGPIAIYNQYAAAGSI